jgi:hypothetical protein
MKKWLKENWIKIIGIAVLIIVAVLVSSKKDTYRGFYYPDGCLTCDNYIVSPDLNSAEDCVKWAEGLKGARGNPADKWECGKNCKWKDDLSVCESTFGEEGTMIPY